MKAYATLIVAFVSLLLLGLSDNIRGPLFPEVLYTFNIQDLEGSLFFSMSSLAGMIGAYLGSWFIKKMGEMRSLQFAMFLMFISQVAISMAPNFKILLMEMFVFGFGLSLMGVMQNVLVVSASPEKYKNKILSGLHSMYAASSLLAPLLVSALLLFPKATYSEVELWRRTFQVVAACSLLLLIATLFKKKWVVSASVQKPTTGNESHFKRLYFAVILGCYVGAEILVSSRIAIYMRREYASTLEESTWYTAGFFVCLLFGRIVFSFWSPKTSVRSQLIASLGLSILTLILGLIIHPILLVLTGLAMAPFYPLCMSWGGEIFTKSLNQAISLAVSFSSIAVLIMHIFLGAVSSWPGIRYGFMIGPLLCLIAIGMLIVFEKVFHQLQPEIRR